MKKINIKRLYDLGAKGILVYEMNMTELPGIFTFGSHNKTIYIITG